MTHTRLILPPDDDHNRALVDHVHPPDWQNPTPTARGGYNLVVLGGGAAGLVTAAAAAGLGARVALIERHLLGGDCLNVGCVPSKALIHAARAAAQARDAGTFGVTTGPVEVDFAAVMRRLRELRATIAPHDSAARFRDLGVDVYLGSGRFVAPDTVEVDGQRLRFTRAVIATGRRPAAPPIDGLDTVDYLTNETVFELTERPATLAVIGAGPVGLELAQSFARLGSQVTVLEQAPRVLPRDDEDAAALIAGALRAEGVTIHTGARLERVERDAGRATRIHFRDDTGAAHVVEAEHLLVAAGRRANLDGLGLEAARVARDDRGELLLDDRLRTTNPRIFAAGDAGFAQQQFTHAADATARLVIANALFHGRQKASRLVIPRATYTEPELAQVGLTRAEAQARGVAVDCYEQPLSSGVDRALIDGTRAGFVRVLTASGSDRIVGATLVGPHAGELVSHLTLAITAGLGLGRVAATVFPYPTHAEALKRVADAYNRTRLTPRVARLMARWFAWRAP